MKLGESLLPPALETTIRLLGYTWRITYTLPRELDPRTQLDPDRRLCYSVWHRSIVMNAFLYRDLNMSTPSSQHRDGELAAKCAKRLGFQTPRGSSTRGGSKVLRELLRVGKRGQGHIGFTSDGPKGPPEQCKPGIVFLAGKLGWPLVPIGAWARPCRILNTWDRLIVPLPFARIVSVAGEPLEVPRSPAKSQLETFCKELDHRMGRAQQEARERLT